MTSDQGPQTHPGACAQASGSLAKETRVSDQGGTVRRTRCPVRFGRPDPYRVAHMYTSPSISCMASAAESDNQDYAGTLDPGSSHDT